MVVEWWWDGGGMVVEWWWNGGRIVVKWWWNSGRIEVNDGEVLVVGRGWRDEVVK